MFRRLEDEPTPAAAASAHAQSVSSKRESPAVTEGGKLLVLGGDIDWRRPQSSGAYHAGSRFAILIESHLQGDTSAW